MRESALSPGFLKLFKEPSFFNLSLSESELSNEEIPELLLLLLLDPLLELS